MVSQKVELFLCLLQSVIALLSSSNILYPSFREHSKNFKSEDMQLRMDGKNCIVTGANSGIGFATAEDLASRYFLCFEHRALRVNIIQNSRKSRFSVDTKNTFFGQFLFIIIHRGASVYLLCRSKERGEAALSKIQTKTGNKNVYLEV